MWFEGGNGRTAKAAAMANSSDPLEPMNTVLLALHMLDSADGMGDGENDTQDDGGTDAIKGYKYATSERSKQETCSNGELTESCSTGGYEKY
jgi:acyl-CoA-binding protein